MKLFHSAYSLAAVLVLAVSRPFVVAFGAVLDVASTLFYLAFPAPTRTRLDLIGALQPDPVLGRDETRAFAGRLAARQTQTRSRAPDSMAFISA